MAKRNRGFTRSTYEKRLKEGRGTGEGANYKPWLTAQDVPSIGLTSRFSDVKTGRPHIFFSNNETNYFYIVDFSNYVTDIREQYPLLPIEETIAISDELGIKHPTDPNTNEEIVMTSDFLITLRNGQNRKYVSRTIKMFSDLSKRQIEKFEIERRYWSKKGIGWGIVTEKEINKGFAHNIELVYQFYNLKDLQGFQYFNDNQILEITEEFKRKILGVSAVREIASEFERNMMLEPGCGISIFKNLIITKQIHIDMVSDLNINKPILIEKELKNDIV